MVDSVRELIRQPDFREYNQILIDGSYYETLFPFLLAVAVFYTVLSSPRINLFRTNSDYFNKAGAMVASLAVSFYGVTFETSAGRTVGDLLMMMFPNISALTIGFLAIYIVGAMFGKDFFRGIFGRTGSAYAYFAMGAIGLGAVVFYLGIAFGAWDLDPFDQTSYWNIVLGVALLIIGVVLIVSEYFALGTLILIVIGSYIYNFDDSSIVDYIIDPVIFIAFIIVILISYLSPGSKEWKDRARYEHSRDELSLQRYRNLYGGEPGPYQSRIYDITKSGSDKRKKDFKKYFPDEEL